MEELGAVVDKLLELAIEDTGGNRETAIELVDTWTELGPPKPSENRLFLNEKLLMDATRADLEKEARLYELLKLYAKERISELTNLIEFVQGEKVKSLIVRKLRKEGLLSDETPAS